MKLLKTDITTKSPFKDCDSNTVGAAYKIGLVKGYGPDELRPNQKITVDELKLIIDRFIKINNQK